MKAVLNPSSRLIISLTILFTAFSNLAANAQVITDTGSIHNIVRQFVNKQIKVKSISQVVISPDGRQIAWSCDGPDGSQVIYRAPLGHPENTTWVTSAKAGEWFNENEPQWSPDGKEIAFLSDKNSKGQAQIFVTGTAGNEKAQQLTHFDGYVSHLHWSPDGKILSVLYVEKATREPSPMAAENRTVGVIDSLASKDIQRLVTVERSTQKTNIRSPSGLYIFEYNWSPDSKKFVYTAALPPGDDNWYMAKLYTQNINNADTTLVYKPAFQIALPRWSPDGNRIAFIEGLMSDQGGTGGEIFTVAADGKDLPKNLTPDRRSTPAWFTWTTDGKILFTEFVGGSTALCSLNMLNGKVNRLWKDEITLQASAEETSIAVSENKGGTVIAFVRTEWSKLPEIYAGSIQRQKQITHLNTGIALPMPRALNVEWNSEGQNVQGWLLYPSNYDASKRYPMLVMVHGGPAWIATPTWSSPDFNATVFTQMGYFIFYPNARGSYGQGEKFTRANRRDWGYGDLKDMLTGVDTIVKKFPVDNSRIGLMGWSYGGSTAMFAVTQTNRFKAVVAGAGAGDWLSYYGQNSIDKWMQPYFGKSPYDDPEAYRKVSAMTFIKQVKTPTLILVGEFDGESPPAQSLQYWHALKELHVATQLVIYPNEGHSFFKLEDTMDVTLRTIHWFNSNMKN
jgi:dipeptidyl aminopeptidase/acylaminoacyl peptidase